MFKMYGTPNLNAYNNNPGTTNIYNQQECEDGFSSWTSGNSGRKLLSGSISGNVLNVIFATAFMI